MRRYRGKRKDRNEWIYGGLHVDDNGGCWIIIGNYAHRDTIGCCFVRVHPETVGQQIGIQDRDDHEIYQGDVLEDGPVDEPCTVVYKQVNARYEALGIRHTLRAHKFYLCKITGTVHDEK